MVNFTNNFDGQQYHTDVILLLQVKQSFYVKKKRQIIFYNMNK